ncbi:MAG: ribose 5-phosphate isomerase B [Bacteroidia bacterium]|nr:ribose 5-phosphate isomerase B [Bacteroidia bacterium]
MQKIILASDHAGFKLKEFIKEFLTEQKQSFVDVGCYSEDSCDYPDFASAAAKEIKMSDDTLGIVICGSGNGINMAMNRHKGIRSALCWKPEIATLARQHNNANVLALPARFIEPSVAVECVRNFLSASFEGGRHENRVKKLDNL